MKRTFPGMLVLLILAACAAPGATPESSAGESPGDTSSPLPEGAIAHPTGDEPILVVEDTGGFAMVDMLATRLPSFVMLGDGRVIMQGIQTLEFPGPALPPLIERTLTEEGIQEVLGAIEGTNLFTADAELRGAMNMIADATDTVFHLNAGGHQVTVSVYALGMLDPNQPAPPGVTSSEIEAHQILARLRDSLMTLDTTISADGWEAEGWQPYEAEAFRLYVRDVTNEPTDPELPGQVREWPTDDDPAAFGSEDGGFGDGTRCGVVEDELGATWLTELSAANQNTLWTAGDRTFSVRARPLLPGEDPACPELFGA